MLRRTLIALAAPLALIGCTTASTATPVAQSAPATPAKEQYAGVAAANDPRVGPIGEEIMAKGGSATDAAVAMLFALTVVEPQSTSLGGGGFYIRGSATGKVETIDGRETAPAAAGPVWFLNPDGTPRKQPMVGLDGLSTGVPGNIAMAAKAWQRHGRLPWAELLAPAIKLARDGFPITPRLSGSLATYPDRAARTRKGKAEYYLPDGRAPGAGYVLRLPKLARSLEMIAKDGPQSFYHGAFAAKMAAAIAEDTPRKAGMTAADFARYRAIVRKPACIHYHRYRVCTMGPPSSGGYAVLATLKMLERFNLSALGLHNPETWHLFLEAQRLAYADRARYIGDPAFVHVPLAGLLDPAYLEQRSLLISPDKTMKHAMPGDPPGAPQDLGTGVRGPEHGTTHFVAVDPQGDMVSVTSTVNYAFGSGLVYRGFFLNNELTDFSFAPVKDGRRVANAVGPRKRPASSMSPTVVYDPKGKPFLTIGAAGGGLIPVETARAIIGVIDFHLPLRKALGLPFVMDVGHDNVLVEQGTWMQKLAPAFLKLGHRKVTPFGMLLRTTGALHTAHGWVAAYDPRLVPLVTIPATVQPSPSFKAGYSEGQH